MQTELKNMEKRLAEEKLVSRAKAVIAREKGILEYDAHKELIRLAMNQRLTLGDCARKIISAARDN